MIPAPNEDGSASSGSLGLVHPSLPPKPIATAQSTRSVSYEDAVSRSWISDTPPRFDSTPWSFFPISQTPSASLMNKDASHNVPTGFSYTGNRGRKGGRSVNDIPRRSKRTGGPPKAILGGVGGKTFDEMMVEKANGKTQARRSSPGLVHVGSQDRLDKPSAGYTDISGVRVSSDTAAEPLRLTTDYNGTVSERARRNKLVSNRRKGSVASTTDSEEGSSAKYATKDTQQLVHAANSDATPSWRGKEVLVRLPREDGWVSLFSRAEEVKSRRESAEGENKLRQVEKAVDQESTSASTLLVPSQQSSVETGTGEMPRHEVISKGRFGNSAYLKRSLGGILKEGTLKTTPSRTQRRAVSDLFPAQNMEPDEPEKLGSLEDTTASGNGQQTSPTFQGSHFEDISLSSMTTSRDGPTDRAGRVQLSDGERTPRLIGKPESLIGEAGSQSLTYNSDLLTIIPAKPRRRGTLDLQLSEKVSSPARDGSTSQHEAHHQDSKQSGGLHTSAAAYHSSPLGKDLSAHPLHPSSAGTSTEATREPAGEQKQIISLRANAPIWAPMAQSRSISVGSSKTSGLSDLESDGGNSIGTSETDILSPIKQPTLIPPPKLRPTADPFVPVFATETNMVSTAHPVEASKRLVYGSEGDTTDNPVSLRPLVTAFAPAYASGDYRQREGGQARLLGSSGAEGNGRLVPDTFRFVPKLRPTAAAFTPSSFGQKQSAVVDSQISPAATSSQRSLARSSCTGATSPRKDSPNEDRPVHPQDSPAALVHQLYATNPELEEILIRTGPGSVMDGGDSVDLSGLFFRTPQKSPEMEAVELVDEVKRQSDEVGSADSGSREITRRGRLHGAHRSSSERSHENSYLPLAIATMPRNAADFEVTQIPVHRSQPVASPLISARTSEAGPAWQLARDARSADCLPKPSLPTNAKSQMHSRIEPKEDGAVSTGASVTSNWPLAVSPHERRRTSVATSIGNDTFETAEGSPLLPSRSISRATVVPEMRDSPSDMTPFEQPAPDTYARNPSPRPSILINGKGKDRQFREWIFPLHGPRPSISRRHTAPTDLPLKVSDQHHDETLGPAIASTSFDERIETLWNHTAPRRAISPASDPGVLGTGEDTAYPSSSREREASIEFPMRTPNKVLRVINEVDHHPIGALHLPATTDKSDPERVEVMMGDCPRCQVPPSRAGDESVGLLADREEAMPEEGCHALNNLSAVPQGLNDDLFDAVARTQLPPSLMVETSEASAAAQRQHDYEAQEMFQAMLTGQHTMLEKLAELTISRDELLLVVETVRLEQAQLKHLVAKHASTEKEIAALKSQLEALQSRNEELVTARAEAASEAGIHQSRLEDARQDCNALRADMAHQLSKLESSEARGRDQRAENDALLSDKLAAERERDALGKTLLETREELREVANQLRVSQETTETVTEELTSLQRQMSEKDKAVADSRDAELVGLRKLTEDLHESLAAKVSAVAESIEASTGNGKRSLLEDENLNLHSQLQDLQTRLDGAIDAKLALQVTSAKSSAESEAKQQILDQCLADEVRKGSLAEERVKALEGSLEESRRELAEARNVATERQTWNRMSEIRLQSLHQEAVYWRQFALEADRRKYKIYMASKPFQNSPPDAQLQTPVDKGSGPEPETPTQQRKAGGLALSQGMSSALDVTQTPQQGEGRWYGLAA